MSYAEGKSDEGQSLFIYVVLEVGRSFQFQGRDSLIPEIILTLMFANCAQYPAGVTHGQNAGGQILGHDAPCTDNRVIANGYAGHDHDSGTQPAIFVNADGGRCCCN